jgi:Lytic transglycolase
MASGDHLRVTPSRLPSAVDVRPPRVFARAVLIAALASVAVPGTAGSMTPGRSTPIDEILFGPVKIDAHPGTPTKTLTLDHAQRSSGALDPTGVLSEPDAPLGPAERPTVEQPLAKVGVIPLWRFDPELSWYGPNFYGQHTACGQILTTSLLGVAHRTLPCGTLVSFKNPVNGRTITVPVVDRGPYVYGRQWDLTYATCSAIGHCWTGSIYWHLG